MDKYSVNKNIYYKVFKSDLERKIGEKLKDTKIVIGGNKQFYKKRYHLKNTQEIIHNVINAFLETM